VIGPTVTPQRQPPGAALTSGPARVVSERAAHEQAIVSERRAANQTLFDTVHQLREQGRNVSQIVRETGISRKRLDQWLRLARLPERNRMAPKPDAPAFFRDYLARRWKAGCHHIQTLLTELRIRGYTGCFSGLARFLSVWRRQDSPPRIPSQTTSQHVPEQERARHLSPLVAAALLCQPRVWLSPAQAQQGDTLKNACPLFARLRKLVLAFRAILRWGKPETLLGWLQRATKTGLTALKRFAKTVRRNWAAVHNALVEPFSNGPVEGHINRLKTLKRQMYGRDGFELLRTRLLPLAQPS
jgi:transposase